MVWKSIRMEKVKSPKKIFSGRGKRVQPRRRWKDDAAEAMKQRELDEEHCLYRLSWKFKEKKHSRCINVINRL